MKVIWKIKRFLLRIEFRLVQKRYREDTINREEFIKHINRLNDRFVELYHEAEINGWEL